MAAKAVSVAAVKDAPAPDVALGNVSPDNPLAVGGIVIDKTAANPVVARDDAIIAARRAAFRKLAETNMSPAAYAGLHMPSDNDISLMVQDFEIENEQMSSTRYIGTFTVRFSPIVRNYLGPGAAAAANTAADDGASVPAVSGTGLSTGSQPQLNIDHAQTAMTPYTAQQQAPPLSQQPVMQAPAPQSSPDAHGIIWGNGTQNDNTAPVANAASSAPNYTNPAATVAAGSSILVLPYYENISGQTLLWEEPNPWLHMWQNVAPPSVDGTQYIVPLGDIDDMAAGPANAVWSGNYKTLENLRRHYNADAVALAVANRSGPNFTIDMYYFTSGGLRRRITLTPYVPDGATDEEVFRRGVAEVLRSLKPAQGSTAVPARRPSLVTTTRAAPEAMQQQPQSPDATAAQISRDVTAAVPYAPAHPVSSGTSMATPDAAQVLKPQAQQLSAQPQQDDNTPAAPVAASGLQVAAQMNFSDFGAWMDVQRRVAAISPPVKLSLRALSSNSAQFTLGYNGSVAALTDALAGAGLVLGSPAQTPAGGLLYSLSESH